MLLYTRAGWISQSTKIHLKMSCQFCRIDLNRDITFCLAIKIDTQLRSILALCEIVPRYLLFIMQLPNQMNKEIWKTVVWFSLLQIHCNLSQKEDLQQISNFGNFCCEPQTDFADSYHRHKNHGTETRTKPSKNSTGIYDHRNNIKI